MNTSVCEYRSDVYMVCVGIMGGIALGQRERKRGRAIKSLAEKGISGAQKRIRPLTPY